VTGFFVHGGRSAEAVARHGGDPSDWLDLSTGIGPLDACDRWLTTTQAGGGWLIIDEAFADSMATTSVAQRVGDDTRLIVLRLRFGLADDAGLARLDHALTDIAQHG
jgi:hypothetical protein